MMETFKGHWACPNGCRLLSELRRRYRNSILNRFLLKTSFHALLTFIYFCYLFDSLVFGLWLLMLIVSLDIDLVCSGLANEIYRGGGPSMYVYCVVCYCVIVAPYVKSVSHIFVYLYTLEDNSECPMDYEISLLPKVVHTYWPIKLKWHHI